ncbi:hypothetical protein GJA_4486 [Janthinobacterium agaricidamnosum NBRC 102515 = DSM 9628]|uniref:Uncharacterized protein n=2 Tax=Janthinobacterium agaricidamnosum TaxID=55508 RepID=W0VCJ7_9BURK|nr:hypothetical protein GJA_4486 [Janthinobacterium agaricidamnosum NBRC 102515 = DSM 9628]
MLFQPPKAAERITVGIKPAPAAGLFLYLKSSFLQKVVYTNFRENWIKKLFKINLFPCVGIAPGGCRQALRMAGLPKKRRA